MIVQNAKGPSWRFKLSFSGVEFRFVLVDAYNKLWNMEVRRKNVPTQVVSFPVPPEALNNVDAYLRQAEFEFIKQDTERAEALRKQRIEQRNAQFERALQERDLGEPVGETQVVVSEASSEGAGSGGDREDSGRFDYEDRGASDERLPAVAEAAPRKASRPGKKRPAASDQSADSN